MTTKTIPWSDDCPCCGGAVEVTTDASQEEGASHGFDAWAYDGDDASCAEPGCGWTGCVSVSEPGERAGLSDGEPCGCSA